MTIPRIAIKRLDSGRYEWAILAGNDIVEQDAGASSIQDCLAAGIAGIPTEINLVEVSYRGIHFGTFRVIEIEHHAEEVADRIVEGYGELVA